jgi:asparagine synthase (glutamine-hydrolysing)
MCGIAGLWEYKNKINQGLLEAMRDTLEHRGPDDSGIFFNQEQNLGLATRRLAILDLTPSGHMPMERGNLAITYNGEIYNFKEVRSELEKLGIKFTSDSDTEVILQSFIKWGKESVHKFRGMFAFAIWDKDKQELLLCRDRVGVKPLYYYKDSDRFIFASEIKAIIKHPSVRRELDFDALANFLQNGYVPSPLSIYKNIYKLEPGHFLEINSQGEVRKEKYWDIVSFATIRNTESEEEILRRLEDILTESFKLRMVSDVPVGVFLSGGIDSALVSALLMKDSSTKIDTFTIGFDEDKFDETKYAKEVAEHLGTNHHQMYLDGSKAIDIISKLSDIYDEPFSDASAIPTYLVSEFAREKVTVALSADGGDELFGGYGAKYAWMPDSYNKYARLPAFLGNIARSLESTTTAPFFEWSVKAQLLAAQNDIAKTTAILHKKVFYDSEIKQILNNKPSKSYADPHRKNFVGLEKFDASTQLQLFDSKTHMVDDILVKVDRASMSVSLESREPFLDPKIMEYAASIPTSLKRKGNQDKYLLREILYKHVPRHLVDRPKKGFSMPISDLMKNKRAELTERYLDENKIRSEKIFNPEMVLKEKERFLNGEIHGRGLWRLIVFQMWKECWMPKS